MQQPVWIMCFFVVAKSAAAHVVYFVEMHLWDNVVSFYVLSLHFWGGNVKKSDPLIVNRAIKPIFSTMAGIEAKINMLVIESSCIYCFKWIDLWHIDRIRVFMIKYWGRTGHEATCFVKTFISIKHNYGLFPF